MIPKSKAVTRPFRVIWVLLLFVIGACGGGGSTEDGSGDPIPDGSGVPNAAPVVSGITTTERSNPVEVRAGVRTVVSLGDGSRVELRVPEGSGAAGEPLTSLTLTRESTDVTLDIEGMETTGAQRVLEFETFDPTEAGLVAGSLVPVLRIPARELGDIHPNTLTVARVSDLARNGTSEPEALHWLDGSLDDEGNLVFADPYFPDSVAAALAEQERGGDKQLQGPPIRPRRIRYVAATTQNHINWRRPPELVQMVPTPDSEIKRRPIDRLPALEQDLAARQCVTDVVILVHGHNERERDGRFADDVDVDAPWFFSYKRDVWTNLYGYVQSTWSKEQLGCTAFWEFVYPSYRPIFTPYEGHERLDEAFARMVGTAIRPLLYERSGVRVHIVAHSMGGLVARAGVQLFDEKMQEVFTGLTTWGTPHLGGALVSLRYVLAAPIPFDVRSGLVALPLGNTDATLTLMRRAVEHLQMDTPGTRDLRWSNSHTTTPRNLAFDRFFENSPDQIAAESSGEVPAGTFDLVRGPHVFNDNLRALNDRDLHALSDRYNFLFGLTTRRPEVTFRLWYFPKVTGGLIEIGALVTSWLVANPQDQAAGHAQNENDGAVPVASMAGVGVTNRYRHIGDIDHEEYFGAPTSPGAFTKLAQAETTASATMSSSKIIEAMDRCPTLEAEPFEDGGQGRLVVRGELTWPGDPEPGRRIRDIAARRNPERVDEDYPLDKIQIRDDGSFTAEIPPAAIGSNPDETILVARLIDGRHVLGASAAQAGTWAEDVAIRSVVVDHWGAVVTGTISITMNGTGIVLKEVDIFTGYPSYEFRVTEKKPVTWTALVDVELESAMTERLWPNGNVRERTEFFDLHLIDVAANDLARMEGGTLTVGDMRLDAAFTLDNSSSSTNQFYVPIIVQFGYRFSTFSEDGTPNTPSEDTLSSWLLKIEVDVF